MLTAYAESDFRDDAVQHGTTIGVFQQNPRFWKSAALGTEAQCAAFLADFNGHAHMHTNDPVHDCWLTQQWQVPGSKYPNPGPDFLAAPETVNYTDRVGSVTTIIATRSL